MVARDTPLNMIDSARGTMAPAPRRMAVAADMVQTPPIAMPSNTRPARMVGRFGAYATNTFETISNTEKASNTQRRSILRVAVAINRLVSIATAAVAVTACPASPSVTPRLDAIGVSRLAGKNSAVTNPKTPSASEKTAPQAGFSCTGGAASTCRPAFICRYPFQNPSVRARIRTFYDVESAFIDYSSEHACPPASPRRYARPGQRTAAGHAAGWCAIQTDRSRCAFRPRFRQGSGARAVSFHRPGTGLPARHQRNALSPGDRRRRPAAARWRTRASIHAGHSLSGHCRLRDDRSVRYGVCGQAERR